MAITETWLKTNSGKPAEKTYEIADRDSMSVRVSPSGKIVYQLRYRYNGKASRLDIGSYPLMTLKDARIECQRLRAMLERGLDPKIERQVERHAIIVADTVESLFYKFYDGYIVENKKNPHAIKRSFELYVLPKIGKLPASRVTLHQWLDILETRAKESKSITERILINAKQMHRWAIKRRLMTENVLVEISAKQDLKVEKRSTDRVLTDEEIRMLWIGIDNSRMALKNKIFLKLCLMWGCRNGELRLAEKSHFDFEAGTWTVPWQNHKTGEATHKPIIRPMLPPMAELVREAMLLNSGTYLFANEGEGLTVMGRSSPLSLPYNVMQWLRRREGYEMDHWSVHDLRRTTRTRLSPLTSPHIAEMMIGHVLPKVWGTYDRHDYFEEMTAAYEKWLAALSQIIGDQAAT